MPLRPSCGGLGAIERHGKGWPLLELEIVKNRLQIADDADEEARERAAASALTAVLKDAVVKDRIPGRKHRRFLNTSYL